MRVPHARREAMCHAVPVKVKPLRGGLAADLDSAVAARLPARQELAALNPISFSATA